MQYEDVEASRTSNRVLFEFRERRDPESEEVPVVANLEVTFSTSGHSDEPTVKEVLLRTTGGHLTPTEIRRFAWDRWLRAAETIYKTPDSSIFLSGQGTVREQREQFLQDWAHYHTAVQAAVGHPGSRGQDPNLYKHIAALYQALVSEGERAPIKRLSEQLGVNPNTLSGWVRKARQLGHLPKGHQGRAG
jgi:hypothetical protein